MKLHYDPARCKHRVAAEFIAGRTPQGRALWRCSACGRTAEWGPGWTYYGNVECKWCWQPAVDRVMCGDCADERDAPP